MEDSISNHITVSEGILGGKPVVAGRRISVQNVVIWHERIGMSADVIATEYGLGLSDIYAALTYYYDHREQIDKSIREDEAFVDELRRRTRSRLRSKIGDSTDPLLHG